MGVAFLIMVREGFEAALVVAMVLAALRRMGHPELVAPVWLGVLAAAGISLVAGVVLHLVIGDLQDPAEARVEAIAAIAAVVLLTWVLLWLQGARQPAAQLSSQVSSSLASASAARTLALVAFVAVAREGFESVLFLVNTATTSSGTATLFGGLLGVGVAAVAGLLVYRGGHRLHLKTFFTVTGLLLIVFAAGLCTRAVAELQMVGDLGSFHATLVDLSRYRWLTAKSESGQFLVALFGWNEQAKPSLEQALVWWLYALPVTWLFLRTRHTVAPSPAIPALSPAQEYVQTPD